MMFHISIVLFFLVYCSADIDAHYNVKERRAAGGGVFGSFIGLTTYASGPFVIKGKNEADIYGVSSEGYGIGEDYCLGSNSDKGARTSRCNDFFGVTGPTGIDQPENLRRPCDVKDWQCIRDYLAANSKCKPAYGPVSDPIILEEITCHLPVANVSAAMPNTIISGLSKMKTTDFYVNNKSGNLVLVFRTDINITIPRVYFRYQRKAKENIVLADYGEAQYPGLIITVVIPKVPQLSLDLAEVYAGFINDAGIFGTGPGVVATDDPDVLSSYAALFANAATAVKEALLYQAQLFISVYIQENLCDFGLNIAST